MTSAVEARLAPFFLVVKILAPLRALAATIPIRVVDDILVARPATVRVERRPTLRPEVGGVLGDVYYAADRHDGGTESRATDNYGPVNAYDGAPKLTGWR